MLAAAARLPTCMTSATAASGASSASVTTRRRPVSHGWLVGAAPGQQHRSTEDRRHGHGGDLPVPVDAGVGEVSNVCARSRRGESEAARASQSEQGNRKRPEQQAQGRPDRAPRASRDRDCARRGPGRRPSAPGTSAPRSCRLRLRGSGSLANEAPRDTPVLARCRFRTCSEGVAAGRRLRAAVPLRTRRLRARRRRPGPPAATTARDRDED